MVRRGNKMQSNMILYKEGQQSFISWIKKRIDNNMNFLSILEGATGIGKSYAALTIAHDIDPDFSVRDQVVFDFRQMMRAINSFNRKPTPHNPNPLYKKKYKVIIFEEPQTSINKRDWQSKINKLFLYLLSTFRHQNIILLFTSPYSDFIDSASKKLLHTIFKCKGWSKKTKMSHIRPVILQWNPDMQKFYQHSLYVIKDGKPRPLINWYVNKPSKELIIPYEEMKRDFTSKLNDKITKELEALENGIEDKEQVIDTRKELTSRQQQVIELIAELKSQQKVATKLGLPATSISRTLKECRMKGYRVEEFRANE